jgi:hypothetical protein
MRKTWFFLGVLTAVAIQAQRLPLPPRVRTAALALGKLNSSPQTSFLAKTHIPTLFKIKINRDLTYFFLLFLFYFLIKCAA